MFLTKKTNETITELAKYYFCDAKERIEYFSEEGGKSKTNQTSHFIEEEVMKILQNGINNKTDVMRILAWKIGKIKQQESEDSRSFVYHSNWKNCETKCEGGVAYENSITHTKYDVYDFNDFATYICQNYKTLSSIAKKDPKECFKNIFIHAPICLGPVYLITLIFFLSNGEYPIYDRFAYMALESMEKSIEPNTTFIKPITLGENHGSINKRDIREVEKFADNVFENYNIYVNLLKKYFGNKYKTDRDIDRSLWIYGHAFNNKKGRSPTTSNTPTKKSKTTSKKKSNSKTTNSKTIIGKKEVQELFAKWLRDKGIAESRITTYKSDAVAIWKRGSLKQLKKVLNASSLESAAKAEIKKLDIKDVNGTIIALKLLKDFIKETSLNLDKFA